jgi:hypothetical protein
MLYSPEANEQSHIPFGVDYDQFKITTVKIEKYIYSPGVARAVSIFPTREISAVHLALIALAFRLTAIPLSVLRINPYSKYDAGVFADVASRTAGKIATVRFDAVSLGGVVDIWGAALAPFWLLPGPSAVYARFVIATLGALVVYNVAVVATSLYSRRAAVVAVAPMIVYPSFVFVQASLLREALVLFALTSSLRLWISPPPRLSLPTRALIVVSLFACASVVRPENVPLYLISAAVGGVFTIADRQNISYLPLIGFSGGLGVTMILMLNERVSQVITRLERIRRYRARGRATYLADVFPTTLEDVIAFTWVGAAYFLFTPFPWMVENLVDFIIMFEGLVNLLFAAASFAGARTVGRRAPAVTVTLLVVFVVGVTLYGVANANYGTSVRQRQMFVWILYLFGSVGIVNHVRVRFD